VYDRVAVVLVRTRNPLNIGAAARAMGNFGFHDLRLVQPWGPSWAEAKSAMGAAPVLGSAREFPSLAEAVADCSLVVGTGSVGARELWLTARRLEAAGERIGASAGRVAVVFGSEKTGLSNDDLARCHWLLRIPTRDECESMNLGQAVAVVLYELSREPAAQPPARRQPARSGDLDLIEDRLWTLLRAAGYSEGRSEEASRARLRALLRRLELGRRDAAAVLGMLRQLLWKWGG
jgi:tRNA/rRNA methyltransferase